MSIKNLLIGKLGRQGLLHTGTGEILMTAIPRQAVRPPESSILTVGPESLGKVALVRGHCASGILYSTEIIEIWPLVAGNLILDLLEKQTLSLADIQACLENLEVKSPESEKLCALAIGHKKSSPGAVNSASGLTEFDFNDRLALLIEQKVQTVKVQRVYRRTLETLPGDINELNPHFIISLHCNAFDCQASGTEVLYYFRSQASQRIARILQQHLVECLGLPDRGIKGKTAEDRGGYLLRYTKAPCIIAEPFFIDNDHDLVKVNASLDGLAAAYAAAIESMSQVC